MSEKDFQDEAYGWHGAFSSSREAGDESTAADSGEKSVSRSRAEIRQHP